MAEAEVIDFVAKRRPRAGEEVELIVDRAVAEILLSIDTTADSFAAMRGLARSLVDRGVAVDDVAQVAMLVMKYMVDLDGERDPKVIVVAKKELK